MSSFEKNAILSKEDSQKFMIPRKKNIIDYDVMELIQELKKVGMSLVESAISTIKFEPNVLKVRSPTTVVGDIHGQFFDLLTIFEKNGLPPSTNYVFLGDYVDRGDFGIQVITLLFWMKIMFPKNIFLLRGNHECQNITSRHNFMNECKTKYDNKIYGLVIMLFETLPLCCIVDEKFLCVHAGISPQLQTLGQIQKIDRFQQIPGKGLMCDLLWSDPTDDDPQKEWVHNKLRSCSYLYQKKHVKKFLKNEKLQMLIRGHEVHLEGYKYQQNLADKRRGISPCILTVFSAPNYSNKYKNLGAIAKIKNGSSLEQQLKIQTFCEVEHPYILPNHLNAFEWAVPLIKTTASKMLMGLLKNRLPGKQPKIAKTQSVKDEEIKKIREVLQLENQIDNYHKALVTQQQIQTHFLLQKRRRPSPPVQESVQFDIVTILNFIAEKLNDQPSEGMFAEQICENSSEQLRSEDCMVIGPKIKYSPVLTKDSSKLT